MAFLEIRFPTNVSYGAMGGAGWSTLVYQSDGGFTLSDPKWATPRGRWTVSHKSRTPSEWATLIALHRLAQGRLNGFRFQDWMDFTTVLTSGVSNGSMNEFAAGQFQLQKKYAVTDTANNVTTTVFRTIIKPQPNTVTIYDGVTNAVIGGGIFIDYTTGIITGLTPGHSYYWTGQFDVPVRFDNDRPSLSYDFHGAGGGGVSWDNIELVELLGTELA